MRYPAQPVSWISRSDVQSWPACSFSVNRTPNEPSRSAGDQSMSVWMAIILECGRMPADVVPAERQSCGQNVVLYLGALAEIAEGLGLPPLDAFVIVREPYWDEALRAAGWRPPDLPAEWGGVMPLDGRPVTDLAYLAAMAEFDRIVQQAERDMPWHRAADGLATVRGLIAALESDPTLDRRCYGAVGDLRAFQLELEYAERVGTRFYFAVE
jgi:hypothetical protein